MNFDPLFRKKSLRVVMLKTYYPHWGKNTAFNSFINFFDPERFRIEMMQASMGNDQFKFRFMADYIKRKIKSGLVQEYKLNDFMAELGILRRCLLGRPDIVHFLDAEHSLMFIPEWGRKLRYLKKFPPVIAMVHQPPAILERIVNMEILRRTSCVLTVSPHQEEFLRQWLPTNQVKTILLGVNTRHFQPLDAPKTAKIFKCLSGGVWLRDYNAIFATAEKLKDQKDIEFHVVAPASLNRNAPANVFFHENIPDERLMELYQTCHALFLPFKDATANTFLLEGAACGLPIISSDIPGVRSYFPGNEAIRAKENSPDELADAILCLHQDRDLLNRMSQKARNRAMELSWNRIVPHYERLYSELVR